MASWLCIRPDEMGVNNSFLRGFQLDDFVTNNSDYVLLRHDSDTLILLVARVFCRRIVLILKMKVLRVRSVVMITPTWRASCRCFRPANLPRGYPR
jgi:hypothetical protein